MKAAGFSVVYTESAETAAVSCGTSHATTEQRCAYTTLVDIKNAYKKLITHLESYVSAVSLLESGEQRYVNAIIIIINNNNNIVDCQNLGCQG